MPKKQSLWERAIGDEYQSAGKGKKKKSGLAPRDTVVSKTRMEQLLNDLNLAKPRPRQDSTLQFSRDSAPPNSMFPAAGRVALWGAASQLQQQRLAEAHTQMPQNLQYPSHAGFASGEHVSRWSIATASFPHHASGRTSMPFHPPSSLCIRQPGVGISTASTPSPLITAVNSQLTAARAVPSTAAHVNLYSHQRHVQSSSLLQPTPTSSQQPGISGHSISQQWNKKFPLSGKSRASILQVLANPGIRNFPQAVHRRSDTALHAQIVASRQQAELAASQEFHPVGTGIPAQICSDVIPPTSRSGHPEGRYVDVALATSHRVGASVHSSNSATAVASTVPDHRSSGARIMRANRPKYLSATGPEVLVPIQETGKVHNSTSYLEAVNTAASTTHNSVLELDQPHPKSVTTIEVVTSNAVTPADMLSRSRLQGDDKRQSMHCANTDLRSAQVWMTAVGRLTTAYMDFARLVVVQVMAEALAYIDRMLCRHLRGLHLLQLC